MKIRSRITLQFSVIVSVILILFSISIYYFFANHRKTDFLHRLKEKSFTSVKLLSDVDEVDNKLLKIIDRNSVNSLPEEKVLIYDHSNKLIYSHPDMIDYQYGSDILDKIRLEGEITFQEGERDAIGFFFKGKFDPYIVIASAADQSGLRKLNFLKYLLIFGVGIAIVLTLVIGLFFSKQALGPLTNMVDQIDQVNVANLGFRISEGNTNDEVAQVAIKFNQMLNRLELAFEAQRNFVSNASHELRTPLTALTGQLEVALMNQEGDSREILQSLLKEIKQLNKLSNGLLDLAQASLDISEIRIETIRIDELIGLARAETLKRNKNYSIDFTFSNFPEEERFLQVHANGQLLKSALLNVIDNACKYSLNHRAEIFLSIHKKTINIEVRDYGIGISEADLEKIFEPFFRADNVKTYQGHGIGLTLTKKIVELHQGAMNIQSVENNGTQVTLSFPHL